MKNIKKCLSCAGTPIFKTPLLFLVGAIGIFLLFFIVKKFVERKTETFANVSNSRIGIVSMMKHPKNIETWLKKHRELGVDYFYIRLEDTPDLEDFLTNQEDVYLEASKSTGINEYTEKQVRQTKMVNDALKIMAEKNIDWLIQIDSDEILRGDLAEIRELPSEVRTFWMQNYEAMYEDVPKKKDNCFRAKKFVNCADMSEEKMCASYGNGKGGGRVAPDVSSNGPHRFKSSRKDNNERKVSVIVEHYESCDFEQYKEKYIGLVNQDTDQKIPFPYYNDAIKAAKIKDEEMREKQMKDVYIKYRTV